MHIFALASLLGEICSTLDSRLLEVDSAAENDFILAQPAYVHWAAGQPDSNTAHDGGEDCAGLVVEHGGYWHDTFCESSDLYTVCEKP
nr:hypothetical protein BaRGS_009258 [Batillaria attramentaria]